METQRPEQHDKKECTAHLLPVQDALDVLNGKWKIPIIIALSFGNYRFKELQRMVDISPKMLSKELKELEMNHLVKRTVYDTTPVSVEYELTSHAASLHKLITALGEWGTLHRKQIMKKKTA